jgi:phosphatidylethanolamine/phosphatidyl-N-methylethanolamine N-methyltransferase
VLRSLNSDSGRRPVYKTKSQQSDRWEDEARFIKTWFENPSTTGAVSPSGRALSRAMARRVDPALPGPIIELGPGTGPVTDALLQRGISPERLVLVEYDAAFCRLLARRYPDCRIIQGDAYTLGRTLRGLIAEPAAAIVSSLPLLNRPDAQRLQLLADAFALMRPDAPFVQFTYGLLSPIPRGGPLAAPAFDAKVSAPVWLNLPPARVWVYRALSEKQAESAKRDFFDKLKAGGEKFGDDLRERREKLRAEFLVRSCEARAELRLRTERVKLGIEMHKARVKAERAARKPSDRMSDYRQRW